MTKVHELMHRLHNPDAAALFIRFALGVVFIYHGWMKVDNMDQTVAAFAGMGFSAFWTYMAAYTELVGGIALLIGVLVRYAGLLLAVTMAVAVFKVHWTNGFSLQNGGYEFALTLMLGSLAIAMLGAGKYSLAHLLKKGS